MAGRASRMQLPIHPGTATRPRGPQAAYSTSPFLGAETRPFAHWARQPCKSLGLAFCLVTAIATRLTFQDVRFLEPQRQPHKWLSD